MNDTLTIPGPGLTCPADGRALAPVMPSAIEDVSAAVEKARTAQRAWGDKSLEQRGLALIAVGKRMLETRDEGLALLRDEMGRSDVDSLMAEIASMAEFAKGVVRAGKKALSPEKVPLSRLDFPGKRAVIEAVPRGVVGIISPWNYPILNTVKPLFPALLSGNGVVVKPSEHTPRSAVWLARLCNEVCGDGLVQVVQGDGFVGVTLLNSGIDAVVFTGSVSTGRKVAVRAAELLIPCSIELGGKDAAVVLADCDLERTVAGVAQWAFHNAGQNCAAIERVYVDETIADAFVTRMGKLADKLKVAPVDGEGPADLGPLQNARQLEIVERHVEDARAKGARIISGGERTHRGFGYRPTVIDGCTDDMLVMKDETFGPVVAIARVKSEDEAIRRANHSEYGLAGSVWTKDLQKGERLARRLDVGVAYVNNHSFTGGAIPELPWTGVKHTGYGVAGSRHAYSTFVRRRALLTDGAKAPDPWWMPVDDVLKDFGDALVERSLGSLGAFLKLGGLLGKRVKAIKALASDE